eukprot:CAMPEP_0174719284 /NCGR_PEP_ID=MMETSP1094-20130205/30892_1 /TAXON_ID=156173 /ORGANISM="Chrysochromulina brevifilum, Strain UTEX LB 985" /LENGTH=51 /DNA_ID=CAMNT_0015919557 /DNA_START=8 /DNA_END=163 /DNA_ORIENTATION=+
MGQAVEGSAATGGKRTVLQAGLGPEGGDEERRQGGVAAMLGESLVRGTFDL